MHALPLSAFFLFLEAAAGGVIALFLVHLRGEVSRGFTLLTGWILFICSVLAIALRQAFPPSTPLGADPVLSPVHATWLGAEQAFLIVFAVSLAVYLVGLHLDRSGLLHVLGPVVPLLGLGALWSAAMVQPSSQFFGLGTPLAVLAGALSLGSALVGLSLGHWYLVTPTMSARPLVHVSIMCLAALGFQAVLLPLLLVLVPGAEAPRVPSLFDDQALFFGVRVVFGIVAPAATVFGAWRTARIRSLDSATGLLYIVLAFVFTGEVVARTLFFVTGVAT